MVTAHEDEFDLVPAVFVIGIFRSILEEDIVEPLHRSQVAAPEQDDLAPFRILGFGDRFFCKVQQSLADRQHRFLPGIVGPLVPDDFFRGADGTVADHVRFGKAAGPFEPFGSVDVILPAPVGEYLTEPILCQLITHVFLLLQRSYKGHGSAARAADPYQGYYNR